MTITGLIRRWNELQAEYDYCTADIAEEMGEIKDLISDLKVGTTEDAEAQRAFLASQAA